MNPIDDLMIEANNPWIDPPYINPLAKEWVYATQGNNPTSFYWLAEIAKNNRPA